MRILALETSCDETAAAVVENGRKILTHVVASSAQLQEKYGGVVPEVAARHQVETMITVLFEALRPWQNKKASPASIKPSIDAIAVTYGPGLIGSLLIGLETAKSLAYTWSKPLVPVNHLIGHIYSAWLGQVEPPQFPALALVVSGGHSELILMRKHGEFRQVGATQDDAAGEAFDKVAQLIGLGYPGGPAIEKIARYGKADAFDFPRPMLNQDNLNFSFSGLKTAVLYRQQKANQRLNRADLAASFQEAIVEVLVKKTLRAAQIYSVKSILLTGGVAANRRLRQALAGAVAASPGCGFFCPPVELATDNATYIAAAAFFNFEEWCLTPPQALRLSPEPNLKITS